MIQQNVLVNEGVVIQMFEILFAEFHNLIYEQRKNLKKQVQVLENNYSIQNKKIDKNKLKFNIKTKQLKK